MSYIDFHTHLLPNIDDGVLKFDQIEEMLDVYSKAGFSKIVCTPHLYNPYVKTDIANIKDTYLKVKDIALNFGIDLLLGSEYYYLNQSRIVGIPISSKYQLVELPTTLPQKILLKSFII